MKLISSNQSQAKSRVALPPGTERRQALAGITLGLNAEGSRERQSFERCIVHKFEREHGAQIRQFLPFLLSLRQEGQLGAVLGLRPARQSALFLEQYLQRPVEQAVSSVYWAPVDRGQIVEIGNLASVVPGTACVLFALLASVLERSGFRWVVCTATPQVKAMLDKMDFPSRTLGNADPQRLGAIADDWGTYYASRPQVIAGDARLAAERVATDPALGYLVRRLSDPINQVAATLKSAAK